MKKLTLILIFLISLTSFSCSEKKEITTEKNNLAMNLDNQFEEWIEKINTKENIENNIKAFNFGLFETENGYAMYLIGAEEYDENDDDWATVVDFEPTDKYFEIDSSITKGNDWEEVLKLSTDVVSRYLKSKSFENSFLKNAEAITIGFDDGDLIRIK